MSHSASDTVEALARLLADKGYEIHSDTIKGNSVWWFSWSNPSGLGDVEVGGNCYCEGEAWDSAMEHYFENSEPIMHSDCNCGGSGGDTNLRVAARRVVESWSTNRLADAVHQLDLTLHDL
jgi:hypothetical protein